MAAQAAELGGEGRLPRGRRPRDANHLEENKKGRKKITRKTNYTNYYIHSYFIYSFKILLRIYIIYQDIFIRLITSIRLMDVHKG